MTNPTTLSKIKFIFGWVVGKGSLALWCGLLVDIWAHYPDNHYWGFGPWLYAVWALVLVLNLIDFAVTRKHVFHRLFCHFATLLILLISDSCNINVPYLEWTGRGMPEWGECRTDSGRIFPKPDAIWSALVACGEEEQVQTSCVKAEAPGITEGVATALVVVAIGLLLCTHHPAGAISLIILTWLLSMLFRSGEHPLWFDAAMPFAVVGIMLAQLWRQGTESVFYALDLKSLGGWSQRFPRIGRFLICCVMLLALLICGYYFDLISRLGARIHY